MSLHTDIAQASRLYPHGIALSLEGNDIGYHRLHEEISAFCRGLRMAQFGGGATIGIALHNSVEFVVTLYAVSRLGSVAALLDPGLPPAEIVWEHRRLGLSGLVIENYSYRNLLKSEPAFCRSTRFVVRGDEGDGTPYISGLLELGRESASASGTVGWVEETRPEDRALIQSTSGTTGNRKWAYRTHGNIKADLGNIVGTFGYRKSDSIYCPVPLCHGYGLTMGLLAPIRCGARVIIDRLFMLNRAMDVLERLHPTIFVGVPSMYDSMVQDQHSGSVLRSLRYCMCSGESLNENVAFTFHELYGRWINQIYGMMETSLISANVYADRTSVLSVGLPARDVLIAFEKRSPCVNSDVTEGEVCVKSDAISPGYVIEHGVADLPRKNGWFLTGDWGYWDARAGGLHVVGRRRQ